MGWSFYRLVRSPTSADNVTGGAGDDLIVGLQAAAGATYSLLDKIAGGDGTDTFELTNSQNAVAVAPASLSGVENLIYRATDGGADIDLANFASVTSFTLDRPVAGVDVEGVALTDTVVISQLSATSDTTLTYGGTLTGAADASAITINGATAGADLELSGDVETITVNVGAATSLADLVLDAGTTTLVVNADANLTVATTLTGTGVTSLTVTGAGNLTITPDLADATATVNASAATGNINVDAGDVAEAAVGTTDFTFTGGAGNDTLDLSSLNVAREVQIDMGAGNDLVILDGAFIATTADAANGGDGDDTLRYTASTTLDADFSTQVSGFETLEVSGAATITMATLSEFAPNNFKSIVADAAADDDGGLVVVSLDGLVTGATVTLDAAAGAATRDGDATENNDGVELNVSLATDGTADSITINVAESYEEIGDDAEDDFETVNLNFTGTANGVIDTVDFGAAKALNITSTTGKDLTLGAVTTATTAVVDATASSDDLTIVFGNAIKSFAGSSETNTITLAAGDLASTSTFAGGAATDDVLNATLTQDQNTGILNVSAFENLRITTEAGNNDAAVIDVRNLSDVATIRITAGDAADTATINRINDGVTLQFGSAMGAITTSTQTGTTQTIQALGNFTMAGVTLDAATTTLNVIASDGDTTGDEAGIDLDGLTGVALTSVVITGIDDADLGTVAATVTSIDGSAMTGALTVTAGGANGTIKGGTDADSLTGGAGRDVITGGDGIDTISGGAGIDTYIFAASGTANDQDNLTIVVADDKLDFTAFSSGAISVEKNGGLGTSINEFASNAADDVDITGKLVLLDDATDDDDGDDAVDTAAEIAALIDGAGDVFSIQAGGKAIVLTGNATLDNTTANDTLLKIFFVHDANGDGDVSDSNEVVAVGTTTVDFDLDTFATTNFLL